MKLSTISEAADTKYWHITTRDAFTIITKDNKLKRTNPRYGKVGDGIYVVSLQGDIISSGMTFAEYIGIDGPVILETSVDEQSLLMDEDALDNYSTLSHLSFISKQTPQKQAVDPLFNHLLHNVVQLLLEYYEHGDDVECDTDESRQFCINLIDEYQIKPSKYFKTEMGHYSFLTARSTTPTIPVVKAIGFNEDWEPVDLPLH